MQPISTYIIEDNPLMRAGITSLLEETHFNVRMDVTSISEISSSIVEGDNLVIISIAEQDQPLINVIPELKELSNNTKIVVLSDNLSINLISKCFSCNADGLLLKSITACALLASLELVMAGEKVFPTSMASIISNGQSYWDALQKQNTNHDAEFSNRNLDIIKCLAKGYSNKLIARQLGITESTVKVHLKTILRKLNLDNRTQVALWAVDQGICSSKYATPIPLQSLASSQHGYFNKLIE